MSEDEVQANPVDQVVAFGNQKTVQFACHHAIQGRVPGFHADNLRAIAIKIQRLQDYAIVAFYIHTEEIYLAVPVSGLVDQIA